MARHRPISLNILPDEKLEVGTLAELVLDAYTSAMAVTRDDRRAFDAAVSAWRERNPKASPEQGRPAVAMIICHKL
jgi:hypothetical protein